MQFGRCKFAENCAYLHQTPHDKINKLEREVYFLKSEIECLKAKNVALESTVYKIATIENEAAAQDSKNYEKACNFNLETSQQEDLKFKCDICDYETT